ncbi:MAG: class C sortase [Dorea sp.]|nr:class C sortase [Dorea sp.]
MKKNTSKIFIVVLFLAGLSLLLYPFVANQWNNYRQKQLISNYEQVVAEKEAAGVLDYEAEWEKAESYNQALLPSILPDAFAVAEATGEDHTYLSSLNIAGDGIMGTVEIPKIKITLPIFHGTDDEVLQKAAGHLEGSSLPVGGENTHSVITAHRGLPSAALFTDLDKMKKGDHFLLHVLDDTLCYEVDEINIIEPEETEALSMVDGMDLVTLVTCTPYGVNSHRMLVRGHRVPYDPQALADEGVPLSNMSLHTNYILWIVAGLLVTGLFSFFLYKREQKLRKKKEDAEGAEAPEHDHPDAAPAAGGTGDAGVTKEEPDSVPEASETKEGQEE